MNFRTAIKWLLFPGLNLHTRLRYRRLDTHIGTAGPGESRRVLDAGCGNGMLSYRAYLKGNTVEGLSIKDAEVKGCAELFHGYLRLPPGRIAFRKQNLYQAALPAGTFQEIICTEVLEHIRGDSEICAKFHAALKPGGILHITSPNALHPYNASFPLDPGENGGHVRAGYTPQSFAHLLEPLGFEIACVEPLGGPVRQFFSRRIKETQERWGNAASVPLFLLALPLLAFETRSAESANPFAYYVKAVKRGAP